MTKSLIITTLAALSSISISLAEGEECKKGKCSKGGFGMSAEKKAELMAKFDADGDGKLSREEMKSAMEAKKKEFMAKHDTDGDGELSAEEKTAAMEAKKKEFMAKFDTDGDGKISEEEKTQMKKAFMERMGKGGWGKGNWGKKRKADKGL